VLFRSMLEVVFSLSNLERRGHGNETKDFDIETIFIYPPYRRKGNGVQFFKNVMEAAKRLERGVYVANCNSEDSRGFRSHLIREKIATPYMENVYGPTNALSIMK